MDSVFYGLVLMFLDLNINSLDILPDWIGYLLMYRGLGQLAPQSSHFSSVRPWCIGMAAVNLLLVFTRFNGTSGALLATALGLSFSAVFLYILYRVIQGIGDLQALYPESNLELPLLQRRWKNTCVITAAICAFPLFTKNGLVVAVLTLAGLVMYILFLMTFHRSRQAYYAALRAQTAESEGHAEYSEPVTPTEPESPTE